MSARVVFGLLVLGTLIPVLFFATARAVLWLAGRFAPYEEGES